MLLRNLILMSTVAGSLHQYFYTVTKQGLELKNSRRPLMKNGKKFTLRGQIRDNMFWNLTCGVTILDNLCGLDVLGFGQQSRPQTTLGGLTRFSSSPCFS